MSSGSSLALRNSLPLSSTRSLVIVKVAVILQMGLFLTEGYITTNIPNKETEICTCPCRLSTLNVTEDAPTTLEEAVSTAKDLENDLVVDKTKTSSSNRAKISVQDERPSAKSVGVVGLVVLFLFFGAFVLLDIGSFRQDLKTKPKKKKTKQRVKEHASDDDENSKPVHSSKDFPPVSPLFDSLPGTPCRGGYSDQYSRASDSNSPLVMSRVSPFSRAANSTTSLKDALRKEDEYQPGTGHELLAVRALMPQYKFRNFEESEA